MRYFLNGTTKAEYMIIRNIPTKPLQTKAVEGGFWDCAP